MADKTISVDPDAAKQNAQKIARHIEELPTAAAVSHHQGTAVGVTKEFHTAMSTTALGLPEVVSELRTLLQASQDAIEKTVAELLARDESFADDANAMLAGIAGIAGPSSTPTSTPTPSAPSGPSADTGGWG